MSKHSESDLKRYFTIDVRLAFHAPIAADVVQVPLSWLAEILHLSPPVSSGRRRPTANRQIIHDPEDKGNR